MQGFCSIVKASISRVSKNFQKCFQGHLSDCLLSKQTDLIQEDLFEKTLWEIPDDL